MTTTAMILGTADDMSDTSSDESTGGFGDSDLLSGVHHHHHHHHHDDVAAQLAAAGPVGVAAAAAIATGKKRKRPHSFETNPSIRKRQQTRLTRKLRAIIDEYATRVGQQACVLICCPGKPEASFKTFGADPLVGVLRNKRHEIISELDSALAAQAPPPTIDNANLHELPPLVIDGIPTPVEKMTQAQLRAFIPMMLKYSTGRGKPGWGKDSCRPVWWPSDLPWANVRSDARTEEQKQKVSWTHALRTIVKNCYKHHGREDLLVQFADDGGQTPMGQQPQPQHHHHPQPQLHTVLQTINNPDGTVSLIQVETGNTVATLTEVPVSQNQLQGTTMGLASLSNSSQAEATQAVATLAEVAAAAQSDVHLQHHGGHPHPHGTAVTMDLNGEAAAHAVATLAEATLAEGGQQIMLTGEAAAALTGVHDGTSQGSMVIPVTMYTTSRAHQSQEVMTHVTMTTAGQHSIIPKQESSDVPVATHAVEVVTLQES